MNATSDALTLSHFVRAGDGMVFGQETWEPEGTVREDFRIATLKLRALNVAVNRLEQQP